MFDEDLSIYFDTAEFGVSASFAGVDFVVILDRNYADAEEVEGEEIYATAATATWDQISIDTVGTVDGQSFRVVRYEPDESGITRAKLEEQ